MGRVVSENREILRNILMKQALVRGEVTLSSGAKSDYYFDCRAVTLSASGAFYVARVVLDAIDERPEMYRGSAIFHGSVRSIVGDARGGTEVVGGPPRGADPIAVAVAGLSYSRGYPIDAFMLRDEPKAYGLKKWVEGGGVKGKRVLIVEDVVSTGDSIARCIDRIESEGGRVIRVVSLIDRSGAVSGVDGVGGSVGSVERVRGNEVVDGLSVVKGFVYTPIFIDVNGELVDP